MLKSIPKEEDKVYKDPKNPNMYITFKKQAKVLDELEEIRSKIKKKYICWARIHGNTARSL